MHVHAQACTSEVRPRSVRHHVLISLVLAGSRWCSLVLAGARWCSLVRAGARWCSLVLAGARWCSALRSSVVGGAHTGWRHHVECPRKPIVTDACNRCAVGDDGRCRIAPLLWHTPIPSHHHMYRQTSAPRSIARDRAVVHVGSRLAAASQHVAPAGRGTWGGKGSASAYERERGACTRH